MMKIKNLFFLVLAFFTLHLQAQDSDVDCNRELSFFDQTARIKDYDAALEHYEVLIENCPPDINAALYQHGNNMFTYFMEQSETQEEKEKYVLAKIENYTKLKKNFLKKTTGNFETKMPRLKLNINIAI